MNEIQITIEDNTETQRGHLQVNDRNLESCSIMRQDVNKATLKRWRRLPTVLCEFEQPNDPQGLAIEFGSTVFGTVRRGSFSCSSWTFP